MYSETGSRTTEADRLRREEEYSESDVEEEGSEEDSDVEEEVAAAPRKSMPGDREQSPSVH